MNKNAIITSVTHKDNEVKVTTETGITVAVSVSRPAAVLPDVQFEAYIKHMDMFIGKPLGLYLAIYNPKSISSNKFLLGHIDIDNLKAFVNNDKDDDSGSSPTEYRCRLLTFGIAGRHVAFSICNFETKETVMKLLRKGSVPVSDVLLDSPVATYENVGHFIEVKLEVDNNGLFVLTGIPDTDLIKHLMASERPNVIIDACGLYSSVPDADYNTIASLKTLTFSISLSVKELERLLEETYTCFEKGPIETKHSLTLEEYGKMSESSFQIEGTYLGGINLVSRSLGQHDEENVKLVKMPKHLSNYELCWDNGSLMFINSVEHN